MWGIILILFVSIVLAFLYKRRQDKIREWILENEESLEGAMREMTLVKERYISDSCRKKIVEDYKELHRKVSISKLELEIIEEFKKLWDHIVLNTEGSNKNFVEKELEATNGILSDIDQKSLDNQQRKAVVVDEDNNLVIAGAGSGKTLTIAGKVSYLVKHLKVAPKDILLITFTKKAADEMEERVVDKLEIPVKVKTFHSLGLEIIAEIEKKKPSINDTSTKLIEGFFDESLNNRADLVQKLISFWGVFIDPIVDAEEFNNLGDYYDTQKHKDFHTLKDILREKELNVETIKGERVKSIEELIIANFLFTHGVEYEYEKKYEHDTGSREYSQYKPDFYLPEYKIYLEHFGITKDERVPWLSEIREKKYLEGMEWKRELHKTFETKLLETYSFYHSEGRLISELKGMLEEEGVPLNPISTDKLTKYIKKMKEDKSFKQLIKLFSSFLVLFKSNNYREEDIAILIKKSRKKNPYNHRRTVLFMEIFRELYTYYENFLADTKEIDFNDMINKATDYINDGAMNFEYKYIIIDEYQDISQARYKLVKAIRENCNSKIMAVGDDWQSIYRFAGSDVSLFTRFESVFGKTEELKIEKTYRNSQELIDIAGRFVMANPEQIKKNLRSDRSTESPIKIIGYDKGIEKALIASLNKISEDGRKKRVMLLGRNRFDIQFLEESDFFELKVNREKELVIKSEAYPNLEIFFLTAHRSKGLEADEVVLINGKNDRLGFPNKISDDPILELVLTSKDKYLYGEERRLFYVALTRTKNSIYLLTPVMEKSIFIKELIEKQGVEIQNLDEAMDLKTHVKCPKCITGILVVKTNSKSGSKFVSCNNYPQCDFTYSNVSIMEKPIKCPWCSEYMIERNGKYGNFYGCTGYPRCKKTLQTSEIDGK